MSLGAINSDTSPRKSLPAPIASLMGPLGLKSGPFTSSSGTGNGFRDLCRPMKSRALPMFSALVLYLYLSGGGSSVALGSTSPDSVSHCSDGNWDVVSIPSDSK